MKQFVRQHLIVLQKNKAFFHIDACWIHLRYVRLHTSQHVFLSKNEYDHNRAEPNSILKWV